MKTTMKNVKISDKKKAARAKVILIILALMFLFSLFISRRGNNKTSADLTITDSMDLALDSIIRSIGYPEFEVYDKADIEYLALEEACPEEALLNAVNFKIEMIQGLEIAEKDKIRRLEEAFKERDMLEKAVMDFNANRSSDFYYSRRICFRTPDRREYTFFQQYKKGKFAVEYFMEKSKKNKSNKIKEN